MIQMKLKTSTLNII